MARLTKAQRQTLQMILSDLRRAEARLMSDDIAVAIRRAVATTTLDYTRADGAVLCEINKEFGADLCGLAQGIRQLRQFLEHAQAARQEEGEADEWHL